MNKNPFSLYDFLGYLFPGLIAVIFSIYLPRLTENDFEFKLLFENSIISGNTIEILQKLGLIVIVSYLIGHIVSYLSSITVEYLSNRTFGYPSKYLVKDESTDNEEKTFLIFLFFKDFSFGQCLWRILVILILFPISIVFLLLRKSNSFIKFITRPLESFTKKSINDKLQHLYKIIGIEQDKRNNNYDYHRIIMHYVYNNIPSCQRKSDNYIAIYGFLRTFTLIACLTYDYIFFVEILCKRAIPDELFIFMNKEIPNNTYSFFTVCFYLLLLQLCCVILYMAFIKYYRRFTLENLMTMLTEKIKENQ